MRASSDPTEMSTWASTCRCSRLTGIGGSNYVHSLLMEMRADIMKAEPCRQRLQHGTNKGTEAGQTVLHCDLHVIPRRKGDIDDPRGGVRGVIPDKRVYQ